MDKITDCEEEPMEIKYESVDFGEFVIPDSSQQFVQIKVEEIAQESTTEINGENVSNEEILGANSSEKNGGKIIKIKEETIPAADSEFVTITDNGQMINNDINGEIEICNENAKEFRVTIMCKICRPSKIFKTLSDLTSHECNINDVSNNKTVTSRSQLKINHPSHEVLAEIYTCPECKETFETKNSYLQHLNIHNKPLHICQTCGGKFQSFSELQLHILIHTVEKLHECEFCQKRFTHKSGLIKHTLVHQQPSHKVNNYIYQCSECNETFETTRLLFEHLKIHNVGNKQLYVCQTCGKKFEFPFALKEHILNAQIINSSHKVQSEIYQCTKCCSRIFNTLSDLNSHECNINDVSNNETVTSRSDLKILGLPSQKVQAGFYKCAECKETFETNNSFLQHLKIHNKPIHVCQICGKKFDFPSMVKGHILIAHLKNGQIIKNVDGEMPTPHREKANNGDDVDGEIGICNENAKELRVIIKCKICSNIFKTLSDLNIHECNINDVSSNKTVTSGSKLKIHHPSHKVQAEIYKCSDCKESFETKNSYLQHLKIHNKPLHVCQTCGEKFQKSDLIKHTLIHKGIKQFKCIECGKEFRRAEWLKIHYRTKHARW